MVGSGAPEELGGAMEARKIALRAKDCRFYLRTRPCVARHSANSAGKPHRRPLSTV
jgi:hypothetical protein